MFNYSSGGDADTHGCISEGRTGFTEGTAEFFKVDKTVLVLVYQTENPEREGALGGAESPGLQQGEKNAELLESQLVLLQIGQAGVVMEQSGTLDGPVAAEEMLPLNTQE